MLIPTVFRAHSAGTQSFLYVCVGDGWMDGWMDGCCICVCVYVFMCVCVYVCMYVCIMHLNLPHTHTTGLSWGAQNASKIDSTIKQICRHHLWIHVCFALFWCGVEDFIPPSRPQGVRIVKNES